MTAPSPPPVLRMTWCPVCARNDWPAGTGEYPDYPYRGGGRCPGKPVTLDYKLTPTDAVKHAD